MRLLIEEIEWLSFAPGVEDGRLNKLLDQELNKREKYNR